MSNGNKIVLSHGSGGKRSRDLIRNLFFKYFGNEILSQGSDSAVFETPAANLAFTTDSFVVDPLFFPGGDIGKLAICGTVNDLAVSGAVPKYLSVGFIIEEGLEISVLESVVISMAETAKQTGVEIVTGDTKVVNKGKCDKLFINTTGIGELDPKFKKISSGETIQAGDKILVNGFVADHGIAVMSVRNELKVQADVLSDCAPLNKLIAEVLQVSENVRFMRDATRGGLATVLAEIVQHKSFGIHIDEEKIPVRASVRGMCEFFGFDPLYVANEGKVVLIVPADDAEEVLEIMQKNELGKEAQIIGEVVADHPGKVVMQTQIGGKRIIDMLVGDQLPRIC
ncbi:hydrogenase expression/formation protein HypE [Prolixibacteraceae bacterium Z1-6]|uniref:Hydrogenase expression/formation protein HypE n=1 Tax=Draconibacterium aestuarii TaxID=2998507 RepID=A0A9X3F5T6_9BACT|nr:hydrogenase expression/formation protein HypE [Prolixibacteraceae bacterium Z1-6]